MNEATLEARVNAELKRIFPQIYGIKLTHQMSFTLKFGHHNIKIGTGNQNFSRGRLDILVQYDDVNLAILELKRPGKSLTDEDRDQGISYARLMPQMPPIVIISNGKETTFYRTFDKKEWNSDSLDEKAVQSLFTESLSCADAEIDQAVQFLLGRNQNLWEEIFRQQNEKTFSILQGDISDYTQPIISELSFPRFIVNSLNEQLEAGEQLIALVGPPLSGKTNVLYQFCNTYSTSFMPLYIDSFSIKHGIIQHITNLFSRKLFRAISNQEIRNWLLNGLQQNVHNKVVLILDGWYEHLTEDLDELIELMADGSFSIIISMDESSFSRASQQPGRPTKTLFGTHAKKVYLDLLDKKEFELVGKQIYDKRRIIFEKGVEYNTEFRHPRLLRIILSNIWNEPLELNNETTDTYTKLGSVTHFHLLSNVWNEFTADVHFINDLNYLIKAYLDEDNNRGDEPSFAIMSYGRGHIKQAVAERIMGVERMNRLLIQGHIELVNGPNYETLILPKVPELLAAAGAHHIASQTEGLVRRKQPIQDAYTYLLKTSQGLPYGDLVASYTLFILSDKEPNIFSDFILKLLDDQPAIESVNKGQEFIGHFLDIGEIRLNIKGNLEDTYTISNFFPWLILSHLSSLAIGSEEGDTDFQLGLFARVGSFSRFLRRPDIVPLEDMQGFHFHDIDGASHVCTNMGIVEPITASLLQGFNRMPSDMLRLCHFAAENNNKSLAWRLFTAASSTQDSAIEGVHEASLEAQQILKHVITPSIEVH
ncbi:hypothetical protein [Priestia megaterium]|uniref:hypothetical protein n=1 Tax=Priestia megaterium TaxID=1404 RepID=UPI002A69E8E8|nr:hypothetical protein [Priestia megaterium]MDY0943422.1 hypothetical protein [Priestia megaterium]